MKEICSKCNQGITYSTLTIIDACCWKCNNNMKVTVVQAGSDRSGSSVGPDEFSKLELEIAQKNGVIMKEQYSKTMDESYLANTCGNCNAFIGNFYLFTNYFSPAINNGAMKYITFEGEPYCEPCTEKEFRKSIGQD